MYSSDLPPMPEEAQAILRYLDHGADSMEAARIMDAVGLSERGFGKMIRRLVTLRLVNMPENGTYALTERGKAAAAALRASEESPQPGEGAPTRTTETAAEEPGETATPAREESPAAPEPERRQLAVLVAEELVAGLSAILLAGFNAPRHAAQADEARAVLLRVTATACEVEPGEQLLEVPPDAAAGPVRFKLTPPQAGSVRVRLEVLEPNEEPPRPIDGMYFDLLVQPYPTPRSAEFKSLGAEVTLPE